MKYRIALVVVGYDRTQSISRLLSSLMQSEYDGQVVDLIISLDRALNDDVLNIANTFEWQHGSKIVNRSEQKLGLRNHMLSLTQYFNKYDALVVLEDDIFVSQYFYNYVIESTNVFFNDPRISCISLYSNNFNQTAMRPFTPIKTNSDVFYMQNSASWGQIWLKNQWLQFIEWYENNSSIVSFANLPENIKNWPKTSWLKYHIAFTVEKNMFCVYPFISLTTNFSDVGQHMHQKTNRFQVPLLMERKVNYAFGSIDDTLSSYDVYYENMALKHKLNIVYDDIMIDIYGTKKFNNQRYVLSPKLLNYKIIKSFGLSLYPHDANIFYNIIGSNIYLYDTQYKKIQSKKYFINTKKLTYDFNHLNFSLIKIINFIIYKLFSKIFK